MKIRVRIAPSPTGFMHVGTARTALFNWLFAKKLGGVFILRIEDTDEERSTKEFETSILDGLTWLGLTWDEGPSSKSEYVGEYGPYRQSERGDIYARYVKKLLTEKLAYYCFCSEAELEAARQAMLASGHAPKYSGKCRNLSEKIVAENTANGTSSVIRLRIPEDKIQVTDMIRGKTSFDMSLVGDIAIAKNPRAPFFNFANVVDDFEMKISHVIRGEDHFTNTPKQLAIGEALGFPKPEFAHIPLILNPDRSKMSKRHGDTSVDEYIKAGYLSEALINFLVLLGWHPLPEVDRETGKVIEREVFTREELVERFDIERVQKGGAVFNVDKLDWMNTQYLKKLNDNEFLTAITGAKNFPKKTSIDEERLPKIIALVRDRVKKLSDFDELAGFFFARPEYHHTLLLWKQTTAETTLLNLIALQKEFSTINPHAFDRGTLETKLTAITESKGRGEVFWPLRVCLSGQDASPGPIEIMEILGKNESLARIEVAIEKLRKSA